MISYAVILFISFYFYERGIYCEKYYAGDLHFITIGNSSLIFVYIYIYIVNIRFVMCIFGPHIGGIRYHISIYRFAVSFTDGARICLKTEPTDRILMHVNMLASLCMVKTISSP